MLSLEGCSSTDYLLLGIWIMDEQTITTHWMKFSTVSTIDVSVQRRNVDPFLAVYDDVHN